MRTKKVKKIKNNYDQILVVPIPRRAFWIHYKSAFLYAATTYIIFLFFKKKKNLIPKIKVSGIMILAYEQSLISGPCND